MHQSVLAFMSFALPQFNGFQEHKMDPKYRVAIPASWRPEEGQQLILQESSRYGVPCVRVLTLAAFAEMERIIRSSTQHSAGEIREALEFLHASILPVSVNNQGKLLIPKEWSQRAHLAAESTVMMVGRGEYFDIYNGADYAKVFENQKARVAQNFGNLGIF
jgi:DNA-binding transcriptional regulator/RsmH inhibitor MraZ